MIAFRQRVDQLERPLPRERTSAWREVRSAGRMRVFSLIKLSRWKVRVIMGDDAEGRLGAAEIINDVVSLQLRYGARHRECRC